MTKTTIYVTPTPRARAFIERVEALAHLRAAFPPEAVKGHFQEHPAVVAADEVRCAIGDYSQAVLQCSNNVDDVLLMLLDGGLLTIGFALAREDKRFAYELRGYLDEFAGDLERALMTRVEAAGGWPARDWAGTPISIREAMAQVGIEVAGEAD